MTERTNQHEAPAVIDNAPALVEEWSPEEQAFIDAMCNTIRFISGIRETTNSALCQLGTPETTGAKTNEQIRHERGAAPRSLTAGTPR